VRVLATSVGDASAVVEEGTLSVVPFIDVRAELAPRTSRARRVGRHRLAVTNAGNTTSLTRLSASDPDESLDIRLRHERIEVAPGTTRVVRIRVRPLHRGWSGSPAPLPFQLVVEPKGAPPIELAGAMEHRRMLPRWVPAALVVVGVLLVALLILQSRTSTVGSRATSGAPGGGTPAGNARPPGTGPGGAGAGGGGGGKGAAAAGKAPSTTPAPAAAPAAASATYGLCPAKGTSPPPAIYTADGNHHDGVVQNGAGYGQGRSTASSDQAFTFFGGASDVNLDGIGELGNGDFCLSLDVKTTQRQQGSLLGNRNVEGDGRWWNLRVDGTGHPLIELDDHGLSADVTYVTVAAPQTVNDGRWHNITVLRVGNLVNIYVDQVLRGSQTSRQVINVSNGDPTRIGADDFVSFSGQIDNVLITQGGV
jgi:hypothetical protein